MRSKSIVIASPLAMTDKRSNLKREKILKDGLPFAVRIPRPTKDEALEWLITEIKKGEDSLQNEPLITLEESRRLFGI